MNPPPPPPPPPHGDTPRASGLPPGKYDIFIIPPHSSGSGFLYLPSLQPNVNSFAAGFASALILVALSSAITPALRTWWINVQSGSGMGMFMVMAAIGIGAWALGRQQNHGPGPGGTGDGGGASQSHGYTADGGDGAPRSHGYTAGGGGGASQSHGYSAGGGPGNGPAPGTPGGPGGETPKPSWQRANPASGAAGANTAKGQWEKAREETRKKEEERKAKEAEKKRREDLEKKIREAREKDAREREAREKEAREKEAREKEAREREAREKRDAEFKAKGSSYAFSATGEKTNPWPRPPPPAAAQPSPGKPPPPTAKTYLGTEDDTHSYRPYDKARHKKSHSSLYSESSYAASHTTSKTSPPPSDRGPYSTKDPDKIVIKAVYSFTNTFTKPTSQLVSGSGSVTDGLILRITTEGLFIDDDVRGVPQREWDVKAWTMKLVEVWCPTSSLRQRPTGRSPVPQTSYNPVRQLWNLDKAAAASSEDTDKFLGDLLAVCKNECRIEQSSTPTAAKLSASASAHVLKERNSNTPRAAQTGELKSAGLHILRASIRDTEGKRYLFILTKEESWKVATGLQRLRKGTQVRSLGVSTMSSGDARSTLEGLGWA